MPRLVIRKGVGEGTDHVLSGAPCVVGRHASAHFVLGDQQASRNHFRVVQEGGAWFVEDLGSTNGTIVNGRRVTRHPLQDGDVLFAGATEIQFVQKDLLTPSRPAAPVAPRPAVPAVPASPTAVTLAGAPLKAQAAPVPPLRPAVPAKPVVPAAPAKPVVPARPAAAAPEAKPPAAPPAAAPAPQRPAAPIPRRLRR